MFIVIRWKIKNGQPAVVVCNSDKEVNIALQEAHNFMDSAGIPAKMQENLLHVEEI